MCLNNMNRIDLRIYMGDPVFNFLVGLNAVVFFLALIFEPNLALFPAGVVCFMFLLKLWSDYKDSNKSDE